MLQIIRDPELYRNPVAFVKDCIGVEWRKPGAKKPVFLFPTQTLLEYWEEQLLPAFGSWGGARFLLMDALVRDILAETRPELTELSPGNSILLLRLVIDDLGREGKIPYLAQAFPAPGFYEDLRQEIILLKRAALDPPAFAQLVKDANQPLQELALVFGKYQETLKHHHLADPEEKIRLATIESQKAFCWQKIEQLWVIGFTDFTAQQEAFLKQISSLISVNIVFDHRIAAHKGLPLPTIRHGQKKAEIRKRYPQEGVKSGSTLAYLQQALWAKDPLPSEVKADTSVKLLKIKGGYRYELAAIACEIQRSLAADPTLTPDQIGIITAYPVDKVYQILSATGLPLTVQISTPLVDEPAAQALLQPFRVILADLEWAEMIKYLRWGGIIPGPKLYQIEPTTSLAGWQETLSNLYAEEEEKKNHVKSLLDLLAQIPTTGTYEQFFQLGLAWLDQPFLLNNFLPETKTAEPSLQARLLQTSFLGKLRRLIQKSLALVPTLPAKEISLHEFYLMLEAILTREQCPKPTSWANGIRLLSPAEARGVNFRLTFVAGLNEGLIPHLSVERWLLREETIQNWPADNLFPTNRQQLLRERLLFYYTINTAREKLILSCCQSNEEGKPVNPCSFWNDLERLLPPDCLIQADVESKGEDLLLNFRPAVSNALSDEIRQKIQTELARRRDGRSRNGLLGSQEARLLQAKISAAPMSISALEEYASCPFSYFCRRWLKVKPLTEPEIIPSRTEEGSIAHLVLSNFFRRYRGKVLIRNDFSKYTKEIRDLVERYYPPIKASSSGLQKNFLVLGKENLTTTLTRMLKEEIVWGEKTGSRFTPRYLELGFGGVEKEADGESTPYPLVLTTENQTPDQPVLRLWGKIDRVDTDGSDNFIVYDYKTGNAPAKAEIIKGKYLQLPLYLLAVSRLFLPAGQPVGATYYSLRQTYRLRGIWRREALDFGINIKGACAEEEWSVVLGNAEQVAVNLFVGILRGEFPFAPPGECPHYCEYRSICRQQIWGREGDEHAE
jgi:hypothetical protein